MELSKLSTSGVVKAAISYLGIYTSGYIFNNIGVPNRKELLITNDIYHVFNKTIDTKPIFQDALYCRQFVDICRYYRSSMSIVGYSKLPLLDRKKLEFILKEIKNPDNFKINVLSYCIMPTHFHFLLVQKVDGGIQSFVSNAVNSFTKSFNKSSARIGPLFIPRFKYKRITTGEQLAHVSRYINLNPFSSNIVNSIEDLKNYKWGSFKEIINKQYDLVDFQSLNKYCDTDSAKYIQFVLDNAGHQKNLEAVKYLNKW